MEDFTFVDLFAGIGGFRIALEDNGGKCVFSSEIDEHACKMYEENFGENPYCDITTLNPKEMPDFDVLCAGFPCQAFSICGKQKGFFDQTRGTLFFDIVRILQEKQPKAFILENVKNLTTHDKGRTLTVITDTLNKIGYTVNYQVLNAKDFGVPQNRERIILVGNKEGIHFDFSKLNKKESKPMKYFLDKNGDFEVLDTEEYTILEEKYIKQQKDSGLIFTGFRNKPIRKNGVRPNTLHLSRTHRQVNRIYSSEGMHPTIASQEVNGRFFILDDNIVRKLTIDECYRFFGFPEDFKKIGPLSKQYERIGNSVCVPVIEEVFKQVQEQILKGEKQMNPSQFLEEIYNKALGVTEIDEVNLNDQQKELVKTIITNEESNKGVFTALVSSLVYKCLNPSQDIRNHKVDLPNGYSGRNFDTKYVTPFLKEKRFLGAMKESGWLTRSIEQPHPFTRDFPGKINKPELKEAFLEIFEDVEERKANPNEYILALFYLSIQEKRRKTVKIINPIEKESFVSMKEILEMLNKHFYYKYSSRGASILPVIALYSLYQCMIENNFERFKNMKLDELSSHTSSDKSSNQAGDIVVRNIENNEIYEVIEVKFEIKPTKLMLDYAYDKIKKHNNIQRYYILSTEHANEIEKEKIEKLIDVIGKEHGVQIVVNGVFETIKYCLRTLKNTDDFLTKYSKNIECNPEVDYEHKVVWNRILNSIT